MKNTKCRTVYTIDPEKRLVRCILTNTDYSEVFVGDAMCHKDDEFNIEKGMKISRLRAEVKYTNHIAKRMARKIHKLNSVKEQADRLAADRRELLRKIAVSELILKEITNEN